MILGRVRLCKKKERMVWQESKSNLRQSVLCDKPKLKGLLSLGGGGRGAH